MDINSKLSIVDNRVIREVDDINDVKKILDAIEKIEDLKYNIVDTKLIPKEEKLIEHEYLPTIINSGEFTESMLLDINNVAIDLYLSMLDNGIYSFDLLPHNFTYYKGKWVLFDFGAFETIPDNVKTQVRNWYKIYLSAYELLNIVERSELKQYFLNRVKTLNLKKMIPLKNWLIFSFNSRICQILCSLKLYRQACYFYKRNLNKYIKKQNRNERKLFIPESNPNLFNILDNILNTCQINTTFGIGKSYANWTIGSSLKLQNFAYIDNYKICDEFYNYIYTKNLNNITTAVIYPFIEDTNISNDLNYRGLYDNYSQERFNADSVIILDFDELYKNEFFNYEQFVNCIAGFSNKYLIIRIDNTTANLDTLTNNLEKYYNNISIQEFDNFKFLVAKTKEKRIFIQKPSEAYENNNRMLCAAIHDKEVIDIIKKIN